MIDLKDCIELGYLSKTHGIRGELVARLNGLSFDDIEEMELVYVIIDGLPVPFFIEEFSEKNENSILLKLEFINTETEAKKLVEKVIFTPRKSVSGDSVHAIQINDNLIGYLVVDIHSGKLGTLNAVILNTNNPLIHITKGAQEIYLPLQDKFIIEINDEKQTIFVQCPEGLISLYS